MASRDGRRRARNTARDRRSRDRSRRAPRRDRSATRPPISVVETGEQEIVTDAPSTEVTGDGAVGDTGGGSERRTIRGASGQRRTGTRRARASRRRGADRRMAAALSTRLHTLDPKRAVILALVIAVVALTLAMPMRTYFAQRSEFAQLANSNEQLRDQVDGYQRKVTEQGDPAYIEQQARERLGMVLPGETPLVMMYPGDDERRAAEQRADERARNPWYQNLWQSVSTPPER